MKSADVDDVHESDEELRFFTSEPNPEQEPANSAGLSLSPTSSPTTVHAPESGPEVLRREARRAKLQRHVVATLSGAGLLLLLAFGAHERALHERQQQATAPATRPAAIAPATRPAATAPATPPVAPRPAPPSSAALVASGAPEVVPPSAPLVVVSAAAEVAPSAALTVARVAAPPANASAVAVEQDSTPAVVAEQDSAALIRKARALLRAGHSREGVLAARDAVGQAPLEAEPYVLLGAGLQDLGDFGEARRVFAECLRLATHGPAATCRYFASR